MFDFAWSELALIGVVALVAIGPKDMPVAIKSVAKLVKRARGMASEFQTHIDDLMKEADLGEMRQHLGDLRSFNLRDKVTQAIDPDGALRSTLADRPMLPQAPKVNPFEGMPAAQAVGEHPMHAIDPPGYPDKPFSAGYYVPAPAHLRPALANAPAFIPPDAVAAERVRQAAPAFIPPASAGGAGHGA